MWSSASCAESTTPAPSADERSHASRPRAFRCGILRVVWPQPEQVLTDNGSAYVAVLHAIACKRLAIKHLRTRPYRPQTNAKAERFIRTLLAGWAYGSAPGSRVERRAARPPLWVRP